MRDRSLITYSLSVYFFPQLLVFEVKSTRCFNTQKVFDFRFLEYCFLEYLFLVEVFAKSNLSRYYLVQSQQWKHENKCVKSVQS